MAIVTNGLIRYFNSKDVGTTSGQWKDLAIEGRRGSNDLIGAVVDSVNGVVTFDGLDDKVNMTMPLDTADADEQTYEMIFNIDPVTAINYLFATEQGNYARIGTDLRLVIKGSSFAFTTEYVTAGTITHYVFVVKKSTETIRLYKNGSFHSEYTGLGASAVGSVLNNGLGTFTAGSGGEGDTTQAFKGKLYAFRIYNRTLADTEITQNYNNGTAVGLSVVTNGLVGYWNSKQGVTSTQWTDLSATSVNLTRFGGSTTVDPDNGIYLDGVDDYAYAPPAYNYGMTGTQAFTLETAIYITDAIDSFHGLLKSDGTPNTGDGAYWTLYGAELYYVTTLWGSITTGYTVPLNQLVFLTFRFDPVKSPSNQDFILNGVFQRSFGNANAAAKPVLTANATIGLASSSGFFKGNIAFIRIYNRALTDAEILQNYNNGTAVGLGTPTPVTQTGDAALTGVAAITATATVVAAPAGIRYIRDWTNGSSADSGNQWVEIQALDGASTNVALNKTVTHNGTIDPLSPTQPTAIVDGVVNSDFHTDFFSGLMWVQVDLGQLYSVSTVKVWHYYWDPRVFNNAKTEVSADGVTWTTIFDSAVSGGYPESSAGHSMAVTGGTPPPQTGAAALTGVATITASGKRFQSATAALIGVAVQTAGGKRIQSATAPFTGVAATAASGLRAKIGVASLTGVAVETTAGQVTKIGAASLTGIATLQANSGQMAIGQAAFIGIAQASIAGGVGRLASATMIAAAGVAATGLSVQLSSTSLTATASVTGTAQRVQLANAPLTTAASLDLSGQLVAKGTAPMTGVASASATAQLVVKATATIIGVASTSATGARLTVGSGGFIAAAGLTATGVFVRNAAVSTGGVAALSATASLLITKFVNGVDLSGSRVLTVKMQGRRRLRVDLRGVIIDSRKTKL